MPQFFIDSNDVNNHIVTVKGDNFYHLVKVRRVHKGSLINLRTDRGIALEAEVAEIGDSSLTAFVRKKYYSEDVSFDLTMGISITKGGNFELSLQKVVELGVNRIIPLISERTVPDVSKKIDAKMNRWGKIIAEAAKQCMRKNLPVLEEPVLFMKLIDDSFPGEKILAHPGAEKKMKDYLKACENPNSAILLIGPEGGFSNKEVLEATEKEWQVLSFGVTQMRAETASIVIPSIIIYEWN